MDEKYKNEEESELDAIKSKYFVFERLKEYNDSDDELKKEISKILSEIKMIKKEFVK